jgi:hypothetical protein
MNPGRVMSYDAFAREEAGFSSIIPENDSLEDLP